MISLGGGGSGAIHLGQYEAVGIYITKTPQTSAFASLFHNPTLSPEVQRIKTKAFIFIGLMFIPILGWIAAYFVMYFRAGGPGAGDEKQDFAGEF